MFFFFFVANFFFGDNKNNMKEYCVWGFLFTIFWKIILLLILIIFCRDLDLGSTSYYLLGCELYQESLRKTRVHSNTLSYDVIAFWGSSLVVRLHKSEEKKNHFLRIYSPSYFLSIMHNYQTTNNNQFKKTITHLIILPLTIIITKFVIIIFYTSQTRVCSNLSF